eukprot:TRINITY_DN5093_c0_g1_i1.p1 TRINITY_DN5093_c0_g1~~TRINITY_DN5093_c0_g1_i1.p1  ORF type:complete len:432 (+),score=81.36 TRINITY_DN5093_c0_g1_i1:84-1379(+)
MAARATPIVIQLKKRTGPGAAPPVEDIDGAPILPPHPPEESAPPPPPAGSQPAAPHVDAQNEDDGSSSSSEDEPAATGQHSGGKKEVGIGSFDKIKSLMDIPSLSSLFHGLHEDVTVFLEEESEKGFDQEKQNQKAQKDFKEAHSIVQGFLDEFAPDGGLPELDDGYGSIDSDGGDSMGSDDEQDDDNTRSAAPKSKPRANLKRNVKADHGMNEQDIFSRKLMPQFIRFATEDQRALQDASDLLGTFVQRHFPSNKDLQELMEKPSPLELFRSLTTVLNVELKGKQSQSDREASQDTREPERSSDRRRENGHDRRDRSRSGGEDRRERSERDFQDRDRDGRERQPPRSGRDGRDGRSGRDADRYDRGHHGSRGGGRGPVDRNGKGERGGDRRGDDRPDHRNNRGGDRDRRGDKGDGRNRGGRSRSRGGARR